MSASTLTVLEKVKARFASGKPAHVTDNDISQYNITIDGKVVKTVVFNLKDFTYAEEAAATNDVEITIDDADVLLAFTAKTPLTELLAAVSNDVQKNIFLLAMPP